jgi:hypothetical protein
MKVLAKFRCNDVSETPYGNISVSFGAVYGTEGENADFSKATPSGQLLMNIDKGTKAATEFVRGEDYYLTFEKAPKP